MLLELHKQFIREKRYVGNASPNTISGEMVARLNPRKRKAPGN